VNHHVMLKVRRRIARSKILVLVDMQRGVLRQPLHTSCYSCSGPELDRSRKRSTRTEFTVYIRDGRKAGREVNLFKLLRLHFVFLKLLGE
jgi:hypothetical protein